MSTFDVPLLHASKYDQILCIISHCEETNASIINEILNTDNIDKHEYILICYIDAEKVADAKLNIQRVINNINIVLNIIIPSYNIINMVIDIIMLI